MACQITDKSVCEGCKFWLPAICQQDMKLLDVDGWRYQTWFAQLIYFATGSKCTQMENKGES